MAFSTVRIRNVGALLFSLRSLSSTSSCTVGIRETVRKFIMENPHLSPKDTHSLSVPAVKGVSEMQEDMWRQIHLADLDEQLMRLRRIPPNSKENPILVGGKYERSVERCICYPDAHFMRHVVLYRDLPMRCQCGNWFKLVDLERYEVERDKHWDSIKDQPENAKLMQDLTDAMNELNRLMEKGKSFKRTSPGADDLLEALAYQWNKLKKTYHLIRDKMDFS